MRKRIKFDQENQFIEPTLSVVNSPGSIGVACNFVRDGIFLNGKKAWCLSPVITGNLPSTASSIAILGPDTTLCQGESITLTSNLSGSGAAFLWSTGATTPSITVSSAGNYILTVGQGPCSSSDTVQVSVVQPALDQLGPDRAICEGEKIVLQAIGTSNLSTAYSWSSGDTTESITVTQPGTYSLTVTDRCGSRTDSVTFFPSGVLSPPNVITANGDGLNEYFNHGMTDDFLQLRIFNRWGKEVFNTSDATERWDGRELPTGLYYYSLEHLDCGGGQDFKKGWIQLFR